MRRFQSAGTFVFVFAGVIARADDVTLGTNRSSGMAGAGLALRGRGDGGYPRNPAMLAYMQKFRLTNLDFGWRADGMSLSDLGDRVSGISKGGLKPEDLGQLARDFGDRPVEFGLSGRVGLGTSGLNFGVDGDALGMTRPNAELQQWAKNGADVNNPDPNMRLDGYGYGFYALDFGYGRPLTTREGTDMAAGVQVRFIKSYYAHHFVDANQIVNGGSTRGGDMGAEDVLSKNGVAVDLGWHMTVGKENPFEFAAVVNNVVEPDVRFDATTPTGASDTVFPFRRSLSLGTGWNLKGGGAAALDVVDIGTGYSELRTGVDVPIGQHFGAAAGYGSRGGFTAAVSAYGVTLTLGSTNGFRAGTFFRF
ncbi:MAG: conjugal transfer protein TraF [Armatimonadetes bacterium]|nr:conjugal transfer protein TraF [Armatimonadota bacterium]